MCDMAACWRCCTAVRTRVYLTPVWPRGVHEKHTQRVRLGEMILIQQVLAGDAQGYLGDTVAGPWPLGHG